MSTGTVAIDGLWLCFRPSLGRWLSESSRQRFLADNATPSPRRTLQSSRCAFSTALNSPSISEPINSFSPGSHTGEASQGRKKLGSKLNSPSTLHRSLRPREQKTVRKLLRQSKIPSDLSQKTEGNLENILQNVVDKLPNHTAALEVVTELVRRRHVRPQARHYRAMILANAQCIKGSAKQVEALLDDMEENGIVVDSGTLHAALKVSLINAAEYNPPRLLIGMAYLRSDILC